MAKGKGTPAEIPDRPDPLMTTDQVAVFWSCSVQAVRDWRSMGIGPAYTRTPGGSVRYRKSDVLADYEARTVRH
jgi:hypothetical protein